MASKYQVIVGLAEQTSAAVASSSETWREFLTTAANNYKYSFNDQLLIHAQRPGATACADIETWNKLGRWVNKGTKGIALLNDEHTPNKLRHVFDIADTNSYYGNTIKLWSLDRAQDGAVIESLENSFGEIENKLSLPNSLLETAKNTVDDNFLDYFSDLISIKADSLLAELDDDSIRVWFKNLLIASVGFMLFTRCGIDTRPFFEPEDFIHIYDFSTPETISVLGSAASDVSEMVLRDIGATVLSLQREAKKADRTFAVSYAAGYNEFKSKRIEGSETNGADLQNSGGLSSAESDRTASPNAGQIWDAEAGIPEGAPQRHLHRSDAVGQAGQPPDGDRQAGGRNDGAFDGSAGEGSGTDREPEGSGSDEVGRADEQHPSLSGGDSESGADLPLTYNLPSVEQQQSSIEEAEAETASAFVISQEDIDAVLTRGGNVEDGKLRIYEQYQKELSHVENIAMLKSEYGTGGSYPAVAGRDLNEAHDGKGIKISIGIAHPRAEILLSWTKVEKRIGELISADRYLTPKDKKYFEEYLQKKEERAERSAIGGEFISIVRDYNDFQRDMGNTAACLNQYVLSDCAQQFSVGSKTTWSLSGHDFILPLMREALTSIISEDAPQKGRASELFDRLSSDLAMALEPSYEEMNPEPEPEKEYRLLLGDVVYLGTQNYEVLSYNKDHVRLYDPSFPFLNKEYPRAEFDQMLRENPLNDSLLVSVDELDELDDEALEEVFAVEEAVPEPEAMDAPKSQPRPKTQSFDLHPSIPLEERNNYRINNDALGAGTPSERYTGNTAAIGLLKQLESEERYASPDEQEILSRYVGWGGLADCFDEKSSHYSQLKALLSEDEYASARESTLTAFYTPPVVIRSIYKALENMGFKSGNILEPSCGVGNFIGMLPESMNGSRLYGVELDSISGRIAQQLYQKSSIAVQGFEKTDLPDSFFDAAIGNVPFGQFKVSDKRYDKNNFLIHDYFFARTLDKVRPGGIIAFVTSKGTLDKENPAVRKYIAQRADLLGAIRLPNDTFKSAAGTEVTSDIIFLQKRDRLVDIEPDWVHLGKDENGVTMNQYYIDNPYMLMGKMKIVSGQFGPESACVPYEGQDLGALLGDAIQNIHAEVAEYELSELPGEDEDLSIPADPGIRNFSYTVSDGRLYYRENSRMNPVEVSVTAENRIKGMTAIRDCVRTLIELQTEDYPDADIQAQQETLNALYDDFAEKYGRINDRANSSAYANDSSYPLLASLEILDDERNFVRKADMFCKRTIKQRVVITSVDTASEALAVSLSEKAKIDMEYMAELTGKTEQELYDDLHGVIFLNPLHTSDYDGRAKYLTADEYLSGNVREKLIWAKRSAKLYPEDYKANVEALEAVQPVDLTASEISVRLGATWLPTEIIEDFTFNLLATPRYSQWNIHVHFSQYTGEWNIEGKSYDRGNFKAFNTYGTDRINAYKIIEETLNLRDVRIFDYIEDGEGHKQAVLNRRETAIAQGKQELIKKAFADWIWNDPERRSTLCKLYNEKFNSNRPREYDGTFLSLVGINPEITLRKHQIDAVARGILGGNELLAHVVGAGKTYTMTAIAQESKRLGLCQKSLFVVPNHLTEQWASEYLQLYPSANILVASKKDFEMKNRRKFCGRIATGDYDAIIIGHSQFEKIPMSIERQRVILEQQLQEIVNGIMDLKRNRGDNFSVKQLERTKKTVKQKIEKLNDQSRKDDLVTFEELGVDRVFIDEAHFYKNLAAFSKMRNVGGISQTEAMKSSDLYMKCRYLDQLTGGRGVVFATGTPISNSMVEMFTMQKYLQYDALRRNNLIHFDAWASTFGETVTAIELAPEGYNFFGR